MDQENRNSSNRANSATESTGQQDNFVKAPNISLPKGGGAIKGMGEKFSANPVTGTGSLSVPIATSPGRSGFGPQLSLSYDSAAGNSPFGLGWSLALPSITRKTDKGLPKYQDADESDIFILSGAEDLVPEYFKNANGNYDSQAKTRTVNNVVYRIKRYRPRIEGLFARIEFWANTTDLKETFWRTISKDNITTWYGKTDDSRIFDPSDQTHIFSWLINESYDDKGNAISYHYIEENSESIDLSVVHEKNRKDQTRTANRYLKSIKYGNNKPYLPIYTKDQSWPELPPKNEWMFEVVFDYGEHDTNKPMPAAVKSRPIRNDPFSTYRSGFEIRTYRLCRRVLMFHHFSRAENVGENCLVRSTDFSYSFETNPASSLNPIYSYLESVTHKSYQKSGADYLSKSLPPLEFQYSPTLTAEKLQQQPVRTIDSTSLENLPYGMDGTTYQWVDLDGEGLSGILTEQGNGWFYKRNLSANHKTTEPHTKTEYTAARFGSLERVLTIPNKPLSGGQTQFMDLAGDGQIDLVIMDEPLTGFYERTDDQDWESFHAFKQWPNLDTRDPNLKFIDLTGDGHADILISEDHAYVWHASLAEAGFAPAQRVQKEIDEMTGPRVIFADGTQSIYLADFSGDGLTDLVRIRNGEVSYWPNIGYCRFGQKVTMSNSPRFDYPDQFDQRRIRLADIDGSGLTDIIYLSNKGVEIYYNQSGNSWSKVNRLTHFPPIDNLASVQAVDLLGNGTACLVWSSPLPCKVHNQMRYIELMGGQKPHLLTKIINNLGAETRIDYAPSTKYYLNDKAAGSPWITKLPYPVHCVEKVTVTDKWRQTSFCTTYSYHHGYFDGIEREFRGFGRVDQLDVETYGKFEQGNANSLYITDDHTLYQPPVKTVTWYHTGAYLNRQTILSHFEHEYFPNWLKAEKPDFTFDFQEHRLPEPDLQNEALNADEWREALRACKGMMLRQEIYELDVDALENGKELPVKLFSTAFHNCRIKKLQPKLDNRHAVFLATESESLTYHYELDLRQPDSQADPRIAHTLNLRENEYGQPQQTIAIAYGRQSAGIDHYVESLPEELKTGKQSLIHEVQSELHIAYSEIQYTEDDIFKTTDSVTDCHRLSVPCETLTYELKGVPALEANAYYSQTDFQSLALSDNPAYNPNPFPSDINKTAVLKQYHEYADGSKLQKRIVDHTRSLFWQDDLQAPLKFGEQATRSLKYQDYKLALTDDLLKSIFSSKLDDKLVISNSDKIFKELLRDNLVSGYALGTEIDAALTGQYWQRSGIAGFAPDAAQHFYLPERYTDPFGNTTTLELDKLDLFIKSSTDALGNTTQVSQFDYRVLAPSEMIDINGNHTEARFDTLGLVVALAIKGKDIDGKLQGDNLDGLDAAKLNPTPAGIIAFCTNTALDEVQARTWLGNATSRFVYHFGEELADGQIQWGKRMAGACSIVREQHASQLQPEQLSPLQVSLECSDGGGNVLMKKVQAEPDRKLPNEQQKLRWIINGLTILNNKGKPVKQYEPYFSEQGFGCELPSAKGVTPVIYYDAVGRTVRTEMPDGSFSRVEFSPWHTKTFDANDTVKDSRWYAQRLTANERGTQLINDNDSPQIKQEKQVAENLAKNASKEDKRAAKLAAQHANTPTLNILDSLGRDIISIAHNRTPDINGTWQDAYYTTYTKLDAEGKPLWIRDARGNLVMQYINPPKPTCWADEANENLPFTSDETAHNKTYSTPCYDIAGNLLYQHSMDAGDRWMLNDAAGKPMFAWNSRGHVFRTVYDALHRPVGSYVKGADSANPEAVIQYEKIIYGETPDNGLTDDQRTTLNLRGKIYKHYDSAGLITNLCINPINNHEEAYDFKGNLLRSTRQMAQDYKTTTNWLQTVALENERFTSSTRYDALNRPVQQIAPHRDKTGVKLNVIQPTYNEANLLEAITVWLVEAEEPEALLEPATGTSMVMAIDYNAKGQREKIEYGNGAIIAYRYDEKTFRLKHLYTKRDASFIGDCVNPIPPPPTMAATESPPIDKPCGLQNLFYTYDPVGNITEIRDNAQDRIYHNNTCVLPGSKYIYDALYRLIKATGREHRGDNKQVDWDDSVRFVNSLPNDCKALQNYLESYCYDSVGNILYMRHSVCVDIDHPGGTIWNRYYQYAKDSNRLLATSLPGDNISENDYPDNPSYSAKYGYDAHGNMTAMPHLTLMRWDFKDQLSATSRQVLVNPATQEKSPETTYYVYDGSGQRLRKVTERQNGTRKEERLYLQGFEVYRAYNGNGETLSLERETLHVMDGEQRIALVETRMLGDDGSPTQLIHYQLGNHLGSSCVEMDDGAKVISYEEYHPYGTTAYQAMDKIINAAAKRYRFTGKERDEETGLNYHGARYYATWLRRWTSVDPGGNVDGTNHYKFSSDNPIVFRDLNGCFGEEYSQGINESLRLQSQPPSQIEKVYIKSGIEKEAERSIAKSQTVGNTTTSYSSTQTTSQAPSWHMQPAFAYDPKIFKHPIVEPVSIYDTGNAYLNIPVNALHGYYNLASIFINMASDISNIPVDTMRFAGASEVDIRSMEMLQMELTMGLNNLAPAISEGLQATRVYASGLATQTESSAKLTRFIRDERGALNLSALFNLEESKDTKKLHSIVESLEPVTDIEQQNLTRAAEILKSGGTASEAGTYYHSLAGAAGSGEGVDFKFYKGAFQIELKTHWYNMMTREQLSSASTQSLRYSLTYQSEKGLVPIRMVEHVYYNLKTGEALKLRTH